MLDRSTAPTPEVQHLPTIFRRIDTGEIRIPSFQRGFVWRETQILALFDSVYRGYPIGSLLLWKVDSEIFRQDKNSLIPFPQHAPREYPVSYVLDGMQRLCCLYGAFNYADGMDSLFNVHFDIDTERFLIPDAKGRVPSEAIPLWSLFAPRRFLELTQNLSQKEEAEKAIAAALELQRVFQEYLIPTVTIANRNPSQVVDIFKRINSTGIDLSAVDFVRALVWDPNFDLNDRLDDISAEVLKAVGQEVSPETLTKLLAVSLDKEPTAQSMYELHDLPVADLEAGVAKTTTAVVSSLEFLRKEFGIRSTDSLPYEGQLIVLTSIFLHHQNQESSLQYFRRWFLATSLNEELRGKPDHFVARLIKEFAQYSNSNEWPAVSVALRAHDLVERRLIKGKALTIGLLVMFALRGARDFRTGEVVPTAFYLGDFSSEILQSILKLDALKGETDVKLISSKIAPNVYLTNDPGSLEQSVWGLLNRAYDGGEKDAIAIAESQFIDNEASELLSRGDFRNFLLARAQLMIDYAKSIVAL